MSAALAAMMGYDPHSPEGLAQRRRLAAALRIVSEATGEKRPADLRVLEARVLGYLDAPPAEVPAELREAWVAHDDVAVRERYDALGEPLQAYHEALIWALAAIVYTRFGPGQERAATVMLFGVMRTAERAREAGGSSERTAKSYVRRAYARLAGESWHG